MQNNKFFAAILCIIPPYSPALPTATIAIAATASATAAAANTATSATNTANATAANTAATANTATAAVVNTTTATAAAANTATSKATATYSSRPQKIIAMTYHQHSDMHHRILKAVYHSYGAQYQSAVLSTLTPAPSTLNNPIYHLSSALRALLVLIPLIIAKALSFTNTLTDSNLLVPYL